MRCHHVSRLSPAGAVSLVGCFLFLIANITIPSSKARSPVRSVLAPNVAMPFAPNVAWVNDLGRRSCQRSEASQGPVQAAPRFSAVGQRGRDGGEN